MALLHRQSNNVVLNYILPILLMLVMIFMSAALVKSLLFNAILISASTVYAIIYTYFFWGTRKIIYKTDKMLHFNGYNKRVSVPIIDLLRVAEQSSAADRFFDFKILIVKTKTEEYKLYVPAFNRVEWSMFIEHLNFIL